MQDKPKRPILSLKSGFQPKLTMLARPRKWKCRPCGSAVETSGAEEPEAEVRCPKCNARLGVAADFNHHPPRTERVRARLL
jgi:rubrerythrin